MWMSWGNNIILSAALDKIKIISIAGIEPCVDLDIKHYR